MNSKYTNEFEESINIFKSKSLNQVQKSYIKLEKARQKFILDFPISEIETIPIDRYVVGNQSHDSFCYILETTLRELGSIKGGSTADKKFGIYYSKSTGKYVNSKKWGNDYLFAYKNILSEIKQLLIAAQNNDSEKINNSLISPMFRGKIITTYFPNKYISIFSEDHMNHFLNKLAIPFDINTDIETKRRLLLQYKANSSAKDLNNFVFMRFLYDWKHPSNIEHSLSESEIEHYFNTTDNNAGYKESLKLVKERKLNQKILKKMKDLYECRCQICGKKIGDEFGEAIAEAHHIEYYSISQNNNENNILILCPNHHSIIHKFDPIFNKHSLSYIFKNGKSLKLKLNKHL